MSTILDKVEVTEYCFHDKDYPYASFSEIRARDLLGAFYCVADGREFEVKHRKIREAVRAIIDTEEMPPGRGTSEWCTELLAHRACDIDVLFKEDVILPLAGYPDYKLYFQAGDGFTIPGFKLSDSVYIWHFITYTDTTGYKRSECVFSGNRLTAVFFDMVAASKEEAVEATIANLLVLAREDLRTNAGIAHKFQARAYTESEVLL